MKIYTNSELEKTIKKHYKENKKLKDFSEHALFIISTIYIRPYTDKRVKTTDFVNINAELMKTLVSKFAYADIMKTLIDKNIIVCDNIFKKGAKSRGYKIVDIENLKWKKKELSDKKLSTKLEQKLSERKAKALANGNQKGYDIVEYWLQFLEINVRRAKAITSKETDIEKKTSYLSSINKISTKDSFCIVDSVAGRLHSPVTNISSKLRKCLSVQGKELYGTDLRNSQPVFLSILMRNFPSVNKEELEKFSDVVSRGNFYEYMAGDKIDLTNEETRKKFKEKIFGSVLFDRNRNIKKLSKLEQIFNDAFPTIYKQCREIKKKDYNQLAIMLQKEEANFFFSAIEEIDKQLGNKKVLLLSLHDSVITDKDNILNVERIILEQFKAKFNITPTMATKKL